MASRLGSGASTVPAFAGDGAAAPFFTIIGAAAGLPSEAGLLSEEDLLSEAGLVAADVTGDDAGFVLFAEFLTTALPFSGTAGLSSVSSVSGVSALGFDGVAVRVLFGEGAGLEEDVNDEDDEV
jgi:hypothetical protein